MNERTNERMNEFWTTLGTTLFSRRNKITGKYLVILNFPVKGLFLRFLPYFHVRCFKHERVVHVNSI